MIQVGSASAILSQEPQRWPVHDMRRPQPVVVDPGPGSLPLPPPADATVLFDGTSLSKWRQANGEPARWAIRDGYFEVNAGTGDLPYAVTWTLPPPLTIPPIVTWYHPAERRRITASSPSSLAYCVLGSLVGALASLAHKKLIRPPAGV
jgi:hypothetical protein